VFGVRFPVSHALENHPQISFDALRGLDENMVDKASRKIACGLGGNVCLPGDHAV
jgi:hypothetical protein